MHGTNKNRNTLSQHLLHTSKLPNQPVLELAVSANSFSATLQSQVSGSTSDFEYLFGGNNR